MMLNRGVFFCLAVCLLAWPAGADDAAGQWRKITQLEQQLQDWSHEAALVQAQLAEVNRKIAALKEGGVNLIEEIQMNAQMRRMQNLARRLAEIEQTIRILTDTRLTVVTRALAAVSRDLATRTEQLKRQQAAGDNAGFTQTLAELVNLDNLKRELESRRELRLTRAPVNLQVADWNSPAEVREKAVVLREEVNNIERELGLTQARISSNVSEIRQKEEIIRFVRDLQGLHSDRATAVDPAVIPHLEQEAARLRGETAQLRLYQGTLTVELAKVREQTDRLTAYADRMERELLQ